jgi:hypothetical protein
MIKCRADVKLGSRSLGDLLRGPQTAHKAYNAETRAPHLVA